MKNRVELRQYLRFQLEQMSARNEQHMFESLTFELARQRISRSIIPATGPVQAGGDQGRDFESYRSYLAGSALGKSSFLGREAGDTLVFGCTLQKLPLDGKIKGDLSTIFGADPKPNIIYYYAAADVPVAKRHVLQTFCKGKYGAHLEILDGQAIADQLSDPDTFWIAEQFLSVPGELFPPVEADQDYLALRERWLGTDRVIDSYTDFLEVKRGLRWSTFTDAIKADLGRWMDLLKATLDRATPQLERKFLYEIAVAQLRGRGTLDPADWAVSRFFETFDDTVDVNEVEDAVVLSTYVSIASANGDFTRSQDKVEGWRSAARAGIERQLASDIPVGSRFRLLLVRRQLEFDSLEGADGDELAERLLSHWEEAVGIAEESPFADIDALEGLLDVALPMIGTHRRFQALADRVDAVVTQRGGKFAAAEQGRRRALQHAELGQFVFAVDQLQRAKEGWFTAETMRGSVLSMLLLSEFYGRLWMPLASRYYAASALRYGVGAQDDAVRPLMARAALLAADSFLLNGEALSYVAAAGGAGELHMSFATDPEDLDKQERFAATVVQVAQTRAMLGIAMPELGTRADALLDAWPIDKAYVRSVKTLGGKPPWINMTIAEIEQKLEQEIGQGLFSDLGPSIRYQWKALGVEWRIIADSADQIHAERIGAALQIALVDLADRDLVIVPSNVEITVSLARKLEPMIEQLPDNADLRYKLILPDSGMIGREAEFTFYVITRIVGEATALPVAKFLEIIDEKVKRGLLKKAFSAQPVTSLFRDLRSLLMPQVPDLSQLVVPTRPVTPPPMESDELAWETGPGPGYTIERAREALENRYRRTRAMARKLVPILRADPAAGAFLDGLHAVGLLDWQILNLLMSVMVGLAAEEEIGGPLLGGTPDRDGIMRRAMARIESGSLPQVDPSLFNAEDARFTLATATMVTMRGWELTVHRQTPDFEAIKRLLDVRYNNSTDDIPHEDHFGWHRVQPRVADGNAP
jgi:hypothetical protein